MKKLFKLYFKYLRFKYITRIIRRKIQSATEYLPEKINIQELFHSFTKLKQENRPTYKCISKKPLFELFFHRQVELVAFERRLRCRPPGGFDIAIQNNIFWEYR